MSFFSLIKTNEHWQLTTLHEAGNINVVFVPSENLHIMRVNLPLSAKNQIQKAVPFAIESNLAQPIESLHFVIGEQDKDGNVDICVVDKTLIKLWRDACQQAGYLNVILLPDIFMLPYEPATWSILKIGSRYLIRTGQTQGLALFQLEHLTLLLKEKSVAIKKIINYSPNECPLNYTVENRHFDENRLTQLNYAVIKSFDLLQGEFALEKKNFSGRSQWRKMLYLGLAAFGVWGLGNGIKAYILSQQERELEQQITRAYRYYFPNSTKVIEPELQLKNLSQHYTVYDPKYLTILLALQAVLKQQPVQLKSVEYSKGKMLLMFKEINDNFFISLEQQLQAQGKIKRQDKHYILVEWSNR